MMVATFILSMLGGFCGSFAAIILWFRSWDDGDEIDMYDEAYSDY